MVKNILAMLGFLSWAYCFINSNAFNSPIWLLPLLYTIGILCIGKNIEKSLSNSPGLMTFNLLMFLRYVATPFAYYLVGVINFMLPNVSNISEGLLIMLYEEAAVFFALYVTGKKYNNRNKQQISKLFVNNYLGIKNGFFVIIGILMVLVYIGYTYKSLGQGLDIFFSGSLNDMDDIESQLNSGQGYINIVWQSLCVWLYVYLLMKEKKNYDKCLNIFPLLKVIVYTCIFILISFVDSTGITRWYTFVTSIASISCVVYLFPKYKKTTLFMILTPVVALLIYSSLLKNGGYGERVTMKESIEGTFGATNMDVYCNGLGNVSAVFTIDSDKEDVGLPTIAIDALSSMPIITHFIAKERSSSKIFHKAVRRDDQIIPMIGQSYFYFGFILSPILSILSIFIFRFFDFKFKYDFSYEKYAYAFAAVWFGAVAMALNFSLTFMWLYIRIIPFFIVLHFTNKLAFKKHLL